MRRSFSPRRWRTTILVVALVAWVGVRAWQTWSWPDAPEALSEGAYSVRRVVDGDTLLLDNRARVRLIGVDTPETVKPGSAVEPWGIEAADFTRRFVQQGQVRLQFDRERVDRFDRFLAYVWVDDLMLNEELLRAGLARWEPNFRYSQSMKNRFRRAESVAREARLGLWSTLGAETKVD